MLQKNEYYFPSTNGKSRLFVQSFLPDGEVKAVLQIAHGVAEHGLRYADFASFLAKQGFLVSVHDHLGHGKSASDENELGFFAEENGWETVVADIEALRQNISAQYPDKPYFMFGHSMGSFLLRTYLIEYPGHLSGAIVSGTGQLSAFMLKAGRLIGKMEAKRCGLNGKSALVQKMAFGSYNNGFKPVRTEFDWLSRDQAVVDAYIADPLCGFDPTVGLFLDIMEGMSIIGDQRKLAKMDKNLPVIFISGEKDAVGGNGKQVKQVYQKFKAVGCADISIKLYAEDRHEILNELNRDEVFADILQWLQSKLDK